MHSLTYNFRFCIPPFLESLLVRCSYLLSARTVMTGSSRQQYVHFKDPKETFEGKLWFLEHLTTDTIFHDDVKASIKAIKDFKKIKHPNTAQIVAFQRFKKALLDAYEGETERVLHNMNSIGLMQMEQVAQYGYLDFYHLHSDDMDIPGQKHVDTNEIMELLPGTVAENALSFFLPSTLFKDIPQFNQPLTYKTDISSHVPDLTFLHPCFELPNLLLLTPNELHSIKMQMQTPADLFHEKTYQWMTFCKINDDPQASFSFFKEKVLPSAERFQQELEQNKFLFQHRLCGNDKQNIIVFLGELSMAAVWKLYYDSECIPEEKDWEELQSRKDEPRFIKPLPVMIMHLPGTGINDNPLTYDVSSMKKSINID